ncbi:MAG: heparan-alpha-glucosaminide N-acetyltransferase domain-containing protein [Bacteroidetes bacterium]|nr:heparan-alpha-glucosaminide N-acetyltransferase domain-containing protein [Bacteroidota bacterium]
MTASVQRNQTADTLKGLAVLFMIQVHIMEQFASVATNETIVGKIAYMLGGPFCATVFLAVMGYFLAVSKKPFDYFIKRGVQLFALGILLNIGRSFHLFISLFYEKITLNPLHFLFGADILTLAGLSIILLAFIRLISKDNWILFLLLMLFFAGLSNFSLISDDNQSYILGFLFNHANHSYFPLIPWFSYVVAGYLFYIIYSKYKSYIFPFRYWQWIITTALSLVIIWFARWAFHIAYDLPAYYHHHFLFFLWCLALMLLYTLLSHSIIIRMKNNLFIHYVAWTGKNVTAIYFIQWLIIGNIATAIYQTQDLLQSEIWFIIVTAVSAALTIAWLKIMTLIKSKNESLL